MDDPGRTGVERAGRPRLTLRGWGICAASAAAFLAASIISNRDLLTLACLLAAMPGTALVYVHRRRVSLDVFRSFSPDVVAVGSVCVVTLDIRNRARRPMSATLAHDENAMGQDVPVLVVPVLASARRGSVEPRSHAVLRYSLTPTARGIHAVGPLVVRKRDLLGLVYWDRAFGGTQPIAVVPAVTQFEVDPFSIGGSDGAVDTTRLASTGGADDTLPREYRPGDAMRRVHWRATARHGDLMVRQDEQQNDPECWILLDNRLTSYNGQVIRLGSGAQGVTTAAFEWAVAMTASLAVHTQQEGYLARVVHTSHAESDAADYFVGPEAISEHDLLLNLASVQLIGGGPQHDYIADVSATIRSTGGGKPVFAVIGDIDDSQAHDLARVGRLCRPAIAFVFDGSAHVTHILEDAGWLCVPVSDDVDQQTAWLAAGFRRKSAHAGY